MRRTAAVLALLALSAAGCTGQPEPDVPGPRVLAESQVPAFVDRVVALNPEFPSIVLFPEKFREDTEDLGRRVCSHMIAGVPVTEALAAAYPRDTASQEPGSRYQQITQIAADTLCPTT
jgi:hypothetical protein